VKYNQQYYKDVFNDEESIKLLDESARKPSLLELVEVCVTMLWFYTLSLICKSCPLFVELTTSLPESMW